MTDDTTKIMELLSTMESRIDAAEAEIASLKRAQKGVAAQPDHVGEIANAIVAYARTRRRCATTSHELRAALGLASDVHGMSIDAALKRIAAGAFAGVTAKADGDTNIPKAGTFTLWHIVATAPVNGTAKAD
jgi:hypothetical protein